MKTYRKFKKNAKALSPVIASIILIAVTVAVSVVVAAWMGGISLGFMGNAEQVTVTNVQFLTGTTANVTVLNSGASSVTLQSATIDGTSVAFTAVDLAKGESGTYTLTSAYTSGVQYNFKLTTAKGTAIVYTATAP